MLPGYMKNVRPPILPEPNATRKRGVQTKAIAPATPRSLGDRVRQARARRGMTRKQLARDSGVSERYLAQIESGNGNISVLVLRRLAKALSMSVDVLLVEGAEPSVELTHTVEFLRRLSADDLKLARHMLLQQFGGLDPAARHRRIALIGLRGAGRSAWGPRSPSVRRCPFQSSTALSNKKAASH